MNSNWTKGEIIIDVFSMISGREQIDIFKEAVSVKYGLKSVSKENIRGIKETMIGAGCKIIDFEFLPYSEPPVPPVDTQAECWLHLVGEDTK